MDITIQKDRDERQVDVFGENRSAPTIAIQRTQREPVTANASPPLIIPPRNAANTSAMPPPPPVASRRPQQMAPQQQEPFDFGDFANAGRVRNESPSITDDDESEPEYDDQDGHGDVDYQQRPDYPDSTVSEYVERPSPGYTSIEEERNALLFKIHRAIRGGMPVDKPESGTDIRDLRTIVGRIENEVALDRSIKFQRKMVCMLTSSIEWVNGKYSWADLDGWSDSVATSIGDYDDIFEELHTKYRGSMAVAPEIRLVFALAASAFWFNLTKSMSKQITNSLAGGGTGGTGGFDISSLLGSMMGGGAKNTPTPGPQSKPPGPGGGPSSQPPPPPSPFPMPAPGAPTVLRKPMRGPDSVGAMFGGAPPPVFVPNDPPKMTDSRKRARDERRDVQDDRSERLSDVVSSDGSDLSDDSSDMGSSSSSGSSDDDQSIKISTVPVAPGGRGRGRGRGRGGGRGTGGRGGTKNVLTL